MGRIRIRFDATRQRGHVYVADFLTCGGNTNSECAWIDWREENLKIQIITANHNPPTQHPLPQSHPILSHNHNSLPSQNLKVISFFPHSHLHLPRRLILSEHRILTVQRDKQQICHSQSPQTSPNPSQHPNWAPNLPQNLGLPPPSCARPILLRSSLLPLLIPSSRRSPPRLPSPPSSSPPPRCCPPPPTSPVWRRARTPSSSPSARSRRSRSLSLHSSSMPLIVPLLSPSRPLSRRPNAGNVIMISN